MSKLKRVTFIGTNKKATQCRIFELFIDSLTESMQYV